ncbi:MAG: DNA repair protein [Clostridia bacterium]|nr:DNA repair protein [Clostridia bacterium]
MGKTAQKQSRARLAALAAEQAQEIAGLRAQLDRTQAQLAAAQAQLDDRRIACEQAGTMAQAAMTLNGVFAAADEAAAQYLENLRLFTER